MNGSIADKCEWKWTQVMPECTHVKTMQLKISEQQKKVVSNTSGQGSQLLTDDHRYVNSG